MKKTNWDLTACLVFMLLFAGLAAGFRLTTFGIVTFIISAILGLIVFVGVTILDNNPPSIGIVTKWGEREWRIDENAPEEFDASGNKIIHYLPVYITEGWNWLFLRYFMFDVILIPIIKNEHDFEDLILMTPDKATTKTGVGFVWTPNKEHAVNYLNLGKNEADRKAMVIDWFENILDDSLRQWAFDPNEGPKNWEGLIAGKDDTIKMLMLKMVDHDHLEDEDIKKVQRGNAKICVDHMGIDIKRLNLTTMEPFGPVYNASIDKDKEKKERLSEVYEVGTDLKKAELLQKSLEKQNVNLSLKECMEQIMAWKIRREGNTQLSLSAITKNIVDAIKS